MQKQKQLSAADMAAQPATPQQLPIEYKQIYRAVFNFHARHALAPQTQEEWTEAAKDLLQTSAQTGNTPFINALLNAVYEELERQQMVSK